MLIDFLKILEPGSISFYKIVQMNHRGWLPRQKRAKESDLPCKYRQGDGKARKTLAPPNDFRCLCCFGGIEAEGSPITLLGSVAAL